MINNKVAEAFIQSCESYEQARLAIAGCLGFAATAFCVGICDFIYVKNPSLWQDVVYGSFVLGGSYGIPKLYGGFRAIGQEIRNRPEPMIETPVQELEV